MPLDPYLNEHVSVSEMAAIEANSTSLAMQNLAMIVWTGHEIGKEK